MHIVIIAQENDVKIIMYKYKKERKSVDIMSCNLKMTFMAVQSLNLFFNGSSEIFCGGYVSENYMDNM